MIQTNFKNDGKPQKVEERKTERQTERKRERRRERKNRAIGKT
jgi:hypothetical protein